MHGPDRGPPAAMIYRGPPLDAAAPAAATASLVVQGRAREFLSWTRRSTHSWSLPLRCAAAVAAFCVLVAAVGLVLQPGQITGAPGWLKPLKFAISIAMFCATSACLLALVNGHPHLVKVVGWVLGLGLTGELVLIDVQVLRQTTSHYNTATPFDTAVFSTMGGLVTAIYLGTAAAALLLLREKGLPAPMAAGIRGGFLVALLGMAEAELMLSRGQHTVGAPDGGPGLPVTGWSLDHGDLRIAHFAGLHALQLLPVLAWLLRRQRPAWTDRRLNAAVSVAALAYAGLVALLAWQAERGQALLHPDRTTAAVALAALALMGVASATVVLKGRHRPRTDPTDRDR